MSVCLCVFVCVCAFVRVRLCVCVAYGGSSHLFDIDAVIIETQQTILSGYPRKRLI